MCLTRSAALRLHAGSVAKLTCVQVPELISQRRRWLNGSFFAAIHSTVHFHYIYRSSHSFLRKFWIHVEMLYQLFNLIFSWFALVRLQHSACGRRASDHGSSREITISRSSFSANRSKTRRSISRVSTSRTSFSSTCTWASSSCASCSRLVTGPREQSGSTPSPSSALQ